MKAENFNRIVEERIQKIKSTLISKGAEYASDNDRLYNFKRAGRISNQSSIQVLLGMMLKHWVSVLDLIEELRPIDPVIEEDLINEKIGDIINYLILLEALLKESL